MLEIPNISQTTAMGSNNSQVGLQYNHEEHHHYGLSVADATSMAFAMFREYYPQLRQEALESLNQMVTEKLKSIPAECIVPPTPRITVPALQNASITEEQDVRELYANLLANSMNAVVKNGIHPGFVEIINQLSPDEAKILKYIKSGRRFPVITLQVIHTNSGHTPVLKNFTNILELAGCENPYESEMYIDNLIRLGLIRKPANEWLTDKSRYEPLKNHPYLKDFKKTIENQKVAFHDFKECGYAEGFIELSGFGKSFCKSCLSTTKVIKGTVETNKGDTT